MEDLRLVKKPTSVTTFEEEKALKEYNYVENAIKNLNISTNMTQREALQLINDYICHQANYDNSAINSETISGFFEDNVGRCHTYALIFNEMARYCGIKSDYVIGNIPDGFHGWNKITFSDDSIYYIDCCWNDTTSSNRYFMLTKDEISNKGHYCTDEQVINYDTFDRDLFIERFMPSE